MAGTMIDIPVAGGGAFRGYLTVPEAGSGPGLLIEQEIFGINASLREVADLYAEEGYVCLVPDLFWRMEPGVDLGYGEADFAKAFGFYQRFDVDQALVDIGAALEALRARPECTGKAAAMGFCLGGKLAYLTAARHDVDAAVSFYGVGIEEALDESGGIACPLLMHFAGEDSFVPQEAVDTITGPFRGEAGGAESTSIPASITPSTTTRGARSITGRRPWSPIRAPSRCCASAIGPPYDLESLWEDHLHHEFAGRDTDATMATMVAEPYVNHVPTMTGGTGADAAQPLLRRALHPEDAEGHDAHAAFPHRGRRPGGGRDDLQLHPQRGDRLDAPRRGTHGQDGERAAGGDRGLPRRQALSRAHLLGSGLGAGADRPAAGARPAGRGRRDRAQGCETLPSNRLIPGWSSD